jgi:hypothetical protein
MTSHSTYDVAPNATVDVTGRTVEGDVIPKPRHSGVNVRNAKGKVLREEIIPSLVMSVNTLMYTNR